MNANITKIVFLCMKIFSLLNSNTRVLKLLVFNHFLNFWDTWYGGLKCLESPVFAYTYEFELLMFIDKRLTFYS